MSMLAAPDTITGPLTAQDLDEARQHSTGSIWHSPHRLDPHGVQWPDTIPTDYSGLDDCAPEGGRWAEPAPAMESMLRHRRIGATVRGVAALAVIAYLAHLIWPLA
jgi:hypothetical protein